MENQISEYHKNLLTKAIGKWGKETQINKLQEELLELALVLNQRNCPTKDQKYITDQLYSELADVSIMMMQARLILDQKRIDETIRYKLNRMDEIYFTTPI